MSGERPGVSRSTTVIHARRLAPALTDIASPQTLLAPASKEPSMDEPPRPAIGTIIPADDEPSAHPEYDAVVMTLASLLGRQMAREHFRASLEAANAGDGEHEA